MRGSRRFTTLWVLGALLTPTISSQTPSFAPPSRKTVYLVEIDQTEQISTLADLNKFATTFLELRLSQLTGVKVVRVTKAPSCDGELSRAQQIKSLTDPCREGSFYVAHGSIDIHGGSGVPATGQGGPGVNEMILNYELLKVTDSQQSPVFRRFEIFTERDVLDTLSIAGNLLASKLATDLKPRVDIQAVRPTTEGVDQMAVAEGLTDALVSRLGFGNAFQPRDLRKLKPDTPSEYTLETRLDFKRSKNPAKFFEGEVIGKLSGVEATFFVVVSEASSPSITHRYQISRSPVKGTLSARGEFYEAAARAVAHDLEAVHSAREAHLTEQLDKLEKNAVVTLSGFEARDLLNRVKEFLCVDVDGPCSKRADSALPLLAELTQRPQTEETREALPLLGQALYLTGQYVKAGETFDLALSESLITPGERVLLLNSAGDAWYKAQNYSKAAHFYADSLEISAKDASALPDRFRTQPDVAVQFARSLRFDGRRLDALDALVTNAKTMADPSPFRRELQELISSLPGTELPDAVKRLEAGNSVILTPTLVIAYNREAATYALRGDFQRAVQTAEKWIALQDSSPARYARALYSYQWAKGSKVAVDPPPPSYKKIAEMALPLVQLRYPGSDSLLLLANHEVHADEDTKLIFDSILAQKPKDLSLLTQKMFLCNEYLKDFKCALTTGLLLEAASPQGDRSIALDVAEIHVLNGKYDDALERIQVIVADPKLQPRLRTVADFYLTWSLVALQREEEARKAATQWKVDLTNIRNRNAELQWVFNGAEAALAREPQIAAKKKSFLVEMLAAMTNPDRPLPNNPLPAVE